MWKLPPLLLVSLPVSLDFNFLSALSQSPLPASKMLVSCKAIIFYSSLLTFVDLDFLNIFYRHLNEFSGKSGDIHVQYIIVPLFIFKYFLSLF